MAVKITNIEYYLPEKILTNGQLVKQFPDWSSDKIEKKIGIRERHIVKEDETALDLALEAGKKIFVLKARNIIYLQELVFYRTD